MKSFIRTKRYEIDGKKVENEVINMNSVDFFFTLEWRLEKKVRYDIVFMVGEEKITWVFEKEEERDRVFNEIKEDFSYEI